MNMGRTDHSLLAVARARRRTFANQPAVRPYDTKSSSKAD